MKYLVVLAVLAAAVAAGNIELKALPLASPYFGYGGYPLAYSGLPHAYPYAAPFRYASAAYAAPLTYAAAPLPTAYAAPLTAPAVAYSAPVVAAPVPAAAVYKTGEKIESTYEPVEQHGYQIAY